MPFNKKIMSAFPSKTSYFLIRFYLIFDQQDIKTNYFLLFTAENIKKMKKSFSFTIIKKCNNVPLLCACCFRCVKEVPYRGAAQENRKPGKY